ncbi:O-antigen ligase family protein [Brevibacillus sp. TJ4]|uniref:O-antigen ligase family protein n=1 Tax=Brevibacillus sp. TJ4 TaxID=3234853 RepID=UPI0037D40E2A
MQAEVTLESSAVRKGEPEQKKDRLKQAEQLFVIVVFLFFAQAFFPFFQAGQMESVAEGNSLLQMIWIVIYGIAAVLLMVHAKSARAILDRDKLSLALLLMVLLSVLWSAAPDITLRRAVAFLGTNLVAIYIAARFTMRELFHLVVNALLIGALCSLFVAVLLPDKGVMLHEGSNAWRGIFSHKNQLGRLMCLGAILSLIAALTQQWPRWIALGGFALCTTLLFMSGSRTAFVVFAFLLLAIPVLCTFRWSPYLQLLIWMSVCFALTAFVLLVIPHAEGLLASLGRDLTLTGRTELWSIVAELLRERLWLGYGYSGFWLGWEGDSSYVWMVSMWEPPNAHNGFLDAAVELGLIGLAIVLLSFVQRIVKAQYWLKRNRWEGLWPQLFLIYLVLCNLTETTLIDHNSFFWTLFLVLGFLLPGKYQTEQKRRTKASAGLEG